MSDFKEQVLADGFTSAEFQGALLEVRADFDNLPPEAAFSALALLRLQATRLKNKLDELDDELRAAREDLNAANKEIEYLSVDQMTKMLVRDRFTKVDYPKLEEVIFGREYGSRAIDPDAVLVLFLDIRNLHKINEEEGHKAGDRLVEGMPEVYDEMKNEPETTIDDEKAMRLFGGIFREGDLACRLGGDEFVIVLPFRQQDVPDVLRLTELVDERLRTAIRYYNSNHPGEIPLALRWGKSLVTRQNRKTLSDALDEADPKGNREPDDVPPLFDY